MCLYKMDYYSAIKNKYRPLAATRIGVDNIILKEVKSDKDKNYVSLSLMYVI